MNCPESIKLESLYRQRYERARMVESGVSLIILQGNDQPLPHTLLVRQHRAKQAQAASAILMHQKHCPVCGKHDRLSESLAS